MPNTRRSLLTQACLVALAAALQAGCASHPDVRHDQDPSVDLGQYRTFAFVDEAGAGRPGYGDLANARLRQAARAQLELRGYVYRETEPDLRVNLALKVVDRREIRSAPGVRGGYRGWAGGIETVDYRQGTLVVDLVDAQRRALVWRGVAEGRVDRKALDNPGPALDAVVQEIFGPLAGRRT